MSTNPGSMNPSPARNPPDPAAAQHAEVDAELVRLRPRQHLVDGERLRELLVVDPAAPRRRTRAGSSRSGPRGRPTRAGRSAGTAGRCGRAARASDRAAANPTDVCDPARAGHVGSCHALPPARRPLPPPHRAPGRRRAARGRRRAVDRVGLDARASPGCCVALFLALALEPGVRFLQERGMKRRGAAAAVIYLRGDRLRRAARRAARARRWSTRSTAWPTPRRATSRTSRRAAGRSASCRRTTRSSTGSARRRSPAAGSLLGGGAGTVRRHRPRRGHRHRRLHHDRLPDAVHDPRGPDLGGARARPDAARRPGRAGATSATGSPRPSRAT